jgi:hypothetical protein
MIGKKTVSAIRADLLEECTKAGIDPAVWFDEQIRKLERGKSSSPQEIETLQLIRDGLQAQPPSAKPRRKRTGTRSSRNDRKTREAG